MDLFKVKTTNEMAKIMEQYFSDYQLGTEVVKLDEGLLRVLSEDLRSIVNVPHFDRSVVDGYAVKLRDVQGASQSIPAFLKVTGQAEMGKETTLRLETGEAVYVPTGGMVPEDAEAMVMIEYIEKLSADEIAVYKSAGFHENMMMTGDDVRIGDTLFNAGHILRPQDIGAVSAIGCTTVDVFKKPKVAIISTGDEVIRPGQIPKPGQIVDINTPAIGALTKRLGAEVALTIYAEDDRKAIEAAVFEGLETSDLVVISGGSSVGEKDYTLPVLEKLGDVFLHGLSVKPGKPTIMAKVNNKPVVGLPGQPASAIMIYMIVMKNLMQIFHGNNLYENQYLVGTLTENIHAAPGRRTFQTVSIKTDENEVHVQPTYGKSGMITLLSYSDGYIEIAENEEGKNAGDLVKVILF